MAQTNIITDQLNGKLWQEPSTEPKRLDQSFVGQTALVTGGTTGIGRATAMMLAKEGADVLIFGRHEPELQDALSDIVPHATGKVYGMIADQTMKSEINKVFDEVDEKLGSLNILINNAGIGCDGLLETDYDEWEYLLHTNFLGHVTCAKMAIERMKMERGGDIIHIGSVSADLREKDDQLYSASKAAIQAFSQSLRKALSEFNIRVSLIEPGSVGTDMVSEKAPPDVQRVKEREKKMLMAEDIAETIRFILSQPPRVLIESIKVTPAIEEH